MMMSRGGTGVANNALVAAGARFFSTTSLTARAVAGDSVIVAAKGFGSVMGTPKWDHRTSLGYWVRVPESTGFNVRNCGTLAVGEKQNEDVKKVESASSTGTTAGDKDEKGLVSYWGIEQTKFTKQDGREWKWTCFRVCHAYCFLSVSGFGFL